MTCIRHCSDEMLIDLMCNFSESTPTVILAFIDHYGWQSHFLEDVEKISRTSLPIRVVDCYYMKRDTHPLNFQAKKKFSTWVCPFLIKFENGEISEYQNRMESFSHDGKKTHRKISMLDFCMQRKHEDIKGSSDY